MPFILLDSIIFIAHVVHYDYSVSLTEFILLHGIN
jgi:hypothetical protein